MEILETFPLVFCFPKSRINENGGNRDIAPLKNTATKGDIPKRKILFFFTLKSLSNKQPRSYIHVTSTEL